MSSTGGLASKRPTLRARFSFLKSAGVRFGLIYAGLFGFSALALAAFLWWSTAGLLDRQTSSAIQLDSQTLADRYIASGLPALQALIQDRIDANLEDDAVYLLVDRRFRRLAGNIESWPPGLSLDAEWGKAPIDRPGTPVFALVNQFELPGGLRVLVGRDIQVWAHLSRMMTDALLWAAVIALMLGTVGAYAVRGLFRATIADVSATAAAISAGDLTRRVRVSGQDDEFDLLAETINDMLERIGRLMDGVRQVSNAIAHDLRTPITRARTRLEDAALHSQTEVELRAAIERAMADLDGIVSVFQALLRISEIEAGARRSAFSTVDLVPLLEDMSELYRAVAEERGMRLETGIPGSLPAFGDRDMIQQAVANLLDNAMKFSPEGSTISVTARSVGGGARIEVADQGPGIPEPDRIRAVERFFRGEQARSTPGSGLGLALVQAVAQLHGGTLTLMDNNPGVRAVLTMAPGSRQEPVQDNLLQHKHQKLGSA